MTAEDIFEDVVESRFDICRRCFKPVESSGEMDSLGGGPSCGEDCSTTSATLEEDPVSQSEMEIRGPRLLSHIQEEYDIGGEEFSEALELLASLPHSPRSLFIHAIRAGIGEVSIPELMTELDLRSEETQRTRNFLWDLPTSGVSEEDLEGIDERVVSELSTVTDSHFPGTRTYYIPNSDSIPDEFQPVRATNPRETVRLVIQENEGWFWRSSSENVESWLSELDERLRACVAECLFEHIESRRRFNSHDTLPSDEQFRRTGLWPVLKEEAENIMGFLRRNDGPQSLGDIAEHIGISESTARTILIVLTSTESVSSDTSTELWIAVDRS